MDKKDLAFVESHLVKMMFYPPLWVAADDVQLDWEILDFPPLNRGDVPKTPGVYAFVVEPNLYSLAPANGLFYVGKATNLYERISAYITEDNRFDFLQAERPLIWKMLHFWEGHLKYYYSTTDTVEEAEALEDEIKDTLIPPFNKRFKADIGQIMRAF